MLNKKPNLAEAQQIMIEEQLKARDISDERTLRAMAEIPRHHFVPKNIQSSAYNDNPLSIGFGQTISQPYIVAFMTQALQLPPNAIVLEIGTGSGYQTAILSRLVAKLYSVERIDSLSRRAGQILQELGIENVELKISDGGYGWAEFAPYDGIITTAAAPEIPPPLIDQLKDGSRLIAPIGSRFHQNLISLRRQGTKIEREILIPVSFVPLIGEHGWWK